MGGLDNHAMQAHYYAGDIMFFLNVSKRWLLPKVLFQSGIFKNHKYRRWPEVPVKNTT